MSQMDVIKYKWETGAYNLQNMIDLVKNQELTSEEFFKITRLNYEAIIQKMGDTN